MPHSALGLIETRGLVGAIEAADAAVKAADVTVASRESVGSGYVAVVVQGTLGDVQAAVEAARLAAEKAGQLVAAKVIARPSGAVADLFAGPKEKRVREPKRPAAPRKTPPAETRSPAAAEPQPLLHSEPPAEERREAPVRSSVDWDTGAGNIDG
jgi:ethanolamine utilization protein EutM